MSMVTFVLVLYVICSSVPQIEPYGRTKRIVFGEPVPSLDTYKTYYFVEIRKVWACLADQTNHELLLTHCLENHHVCGGTLIHPEFVLTAAHCTLYYEVNLRTKEGEDDLTIWEKADRWITGMFVVPKPKHVVYSDWALLVGSNDYYKMKQKRHVAKVIPHQKFPLNLTSPGSREAFASSQAQYHDVALLRACQPFVLKQREVELAPMLDTAEQMWKQYERIVNRGTVCLYIGFGRQDNIRRDAEVSGYPFYKKNLMLHTWRSSQCYSACNKLFETKSDTKLHPCVLCSWHLGPTLGVPGEGDSGGPVTCERNFFAVVNNGQVKASKNYTSANSYPLHCVKNLITNARLEYYKTIEYAGYHPLNPRLRRLSQPQD